MGVAWTSGTWQTPRPGIRRSKLWPAISTNHPYKPTQITEPFPHMATYNTSDFRKGLTVQIDGEP